MPIEIMTTIKRTYFKDAILFKFKIEVSKVSQ